MACTTHDQRVADMAMERSYHGSGLAGDAVKESAEPRRCCMRKLRLRAATIGASRQKKRRSWNANEATPLSCANVRACTAIIGALRGKTADGVRQQAKPVALSCANMSRLGVKKSAAQRQKQIDEVAEKVEPRRPSRANAPPSCVRHEPSTVRRGRGARKRAMGIIKIFSALKLSE